MNQEELIKYIEELIESNDEAMKQQSDLTFRYQRYTGANSALKLVLKKIKSDLIKITEV